MAGKRNAERLKLYINGEFIESENGSTRDICNPANSQVIALAQEATVENTRKAIRAARAAFDQGPWRDYGAQRRGRILFQVAEAVRREASRLARLETLNTGKPIVEAEGDVDDTATCFEYYGGLATKITGDVNPVPDQAVSLTLKEPIGVCGQIIPWNYPLLMAAWKIAPALAAGCTVVLKPAPATPMTALELAKIFAAVEDLPKGVVDECQDIVHKISAITSCTHFERIGFVLDMGIFTKTLRRSPCLKKIQRATAFSCSTFSRR